MTDAGGVITADDYTISEGGTDPGSYTVTITGQNNYSGTKQSTTYKVVYPLTLAKAYTTYVSPFDLQMPEGWKHVLPFFHGMEASFPWRGSFAFKPPAGPVAA